VLTEAEREIGVTLIDTGSGTTDIGIFVEGALMFARAACRRFSRQQRSGRRTAHAVRGRRRDQNRHGYVTRTARRRLHDRRLGL
jgi:hypothetical protein